MPLDGARADEQARADLRIRIPVARESCDPSLLGGEVVARLGRARPHRLARGQQLATRAVGEPEGADAGEHAAGGAQLLARVHPAPLSAQPLAIEEPGAGEMKRCATASEPIDRSFVQSVGMAPFAEKGARPSLDAEV